MNVAIPLATSVVSFLFALTVLDQYMERRRPYQLIWTVGLLLYAKASLLHTLWAVGITGEVVFRLWYLTGAMLVAAYLGMGSLYLHVPQRVARIALAVLLLLTVVSAVLALGVSLQGDVASLAGKSLASVIPGTESQRFYPAYVGILTAILNALGSLVLLGSAIYSAIVFASRRAPGALPDESFFGKLFNPSGQSGRLDYFLAFLVSTLLTLLLIGIYTTIVTHIRRWHDLGRSGWFTLLLLIPIVNTLVFIYLLAAPGVDNETMRDSSVNTPTFRAKRAAGYRVISNVLIAIGAFISAAGGTLERFDVPQPHTMALFLGVVIIYLGFLRSREVFMVYRVPFRRPAKQTPS